MFPIRIEGKVVRAMVRHARDERPLECCGFLTGLSREIRSIRPVRNAKQSGTEFQVEPEDLFAFFRGLRESDEELLGIYHSHPSSPAVPSGRDVEEFHYPGLSYWIVSLRDRPDVKCFEIGRGSFQERGFEIMGRLESIDETTSE